jgi:uncharacterized protein
MKDKISLNLSNKKDKKMEILFSQHDNLLSTINDHFFRFLYEKVFWNQRMIAIKGPRGAGKTTLMLQVIKYRLGKEKEKALYVSADHYWFYNHLLIETADEFYRNGGRYLFIDEVHKYPNWSRELKNIYDSYPDMRTVFTASSALDIYRGEADLSRRVISYDLPGLSFREYLAMQSKKPFEAVSLDYIIENHRLLSSQILEKSSPILPLFKTYLKTGYLPIQQEGNEAITLFKLQQIINTILESDLAYIKGYNSGTAHKIKKLLAVIAESVPFKPNISSLAGKLDASRDSIYEWLLLLEKASLLNLLKSKGKGVSKLQKPDKIYLENSNLAYALNPNPNVGAIREGFFMNQLQNAGHQVQMDKNADFIVDGKWIFEVGGRNKDFSQIQEIGNSFLAIDDIETGFSRKIPLWLFGFLY